MRLFALSVVSAYREVKLGYEFSLLPFQFAYKGSIVKPIDNMLV